MCTRNGMTPLNTTTKTTAFCWNFTCNQRASRPSCCRRKSGRRDTKSYWDADRTVCQNCVKITGINIIFINIIIARQRLKSNGIDAYKYEILKKYGGVFMWSLRNFQNHQNPRLHVVKKNNYKNKTYLCKVTHGPRNPRPH